MGKPNNIEGLRDVGEETIIEGFGEIIGKERGV